MQLTFLGGGAPALGPLSPRRYDLGRGAWVDHQPGWVGGHTAVFEHLRDTLDWQQHRREMYERTVDVPRLTATIPDDGPGHPLLDEIAAALSARYGHVFDHIHLALYRDGSDSVAWHGDTIRKTHEQAVVGIVSLGEPRRFLIRPTGGKALKFELGWGDLLVMGGTCQRTCQHAVPKVAHALPRMSVMFRHA